MNQSGSVFEQILSKSNNQQMQSMDSAMMETVPVPCEDIRSQLKSKKEYYDFLYDKCDYHVAPIAYTNQEYYV